MDGLNSLESVGDTFKITTLSKVLLKANRESLQKCPNEYIMYFITGGILFAGLVMVVLGILFIL